MSLEKYNRPLQKAIEKVGGAGDPLVEFGLLVLLLALGVVSYFFSTEVYRMVMWLWEGLWRTITYS